VPGGERLAVTSSVRGKPVRLWLAVIAHGPNVITLRGPHEDAFERAYAALTLLPVPAAEGPGTLVTPDGAFDFPAGWRRDGRFSVRAPDAMVMASLADGHVDGALETLEAYLLDTPAHGRLVAQGNGVLGGAPAHRLVSTAFGDNTTVVRMIGGHAGRVLELGLRVEARPDRLPLERVAEFEAMAASWRWKA
jgi:hypothetical protein